MKKCFDNVQMFKSSEDCDKYSKSVSVEKWLQISPVLRLVKVLGLVAVLTFSIIAESRADCTRPDKITGKCKTLGESGTCGKGCSYTYDSVTKTVNITATGKDATITDVAFHGSYYENNTMPAQTFVINGAIAISANAFNVSKEIISGTDGVLTLTGIGHNAFGSTTISGTIIIPEGAKFGSIAFLSFKLADNAKIYCGVENCAQKMIDSCNAYPSDAAASKCLNSVNKIVSDGKLLAYPENCLRMGATGCVKCKSESFKLNDGYCDRMRYTPAEAAEVLRDDDNNEVTITFKK